MKLSARRCFNHVEREAVACCPECRRFFCRECISEHQGRVICARCLATMATGSAVRSRSWKGALLWMMLVAAGLLLCWTWFYYLGSVLLSIPSSFHEGTLWS